MRKNWITGAVACLWACGVAQAGIVVSHSGSGTLVRTISPVAGTTDQFDVFVAVENMASSGIATVTIQSNGTDRIRNLTIEGWTGATSGSPLVFVDINGNAATAAGAITELERIRYNPPPPGEIDATMSVRIELDPTAGTGRVGLPPSITPRNDLEAMTFRGIICRELTADVGPPSGFSPGNIGEIRINGDLRANIDADTIDFIVIDGNIGVPTNPGPGLEVRIDADGDLEVIQARNINADINVDGDIKDVYVFGSGDVAVEATDAVFEGELQCQDVTRDGIRIWGDLDADIDIQGRLGTTIGTRIAIGDDFRSTASISIGSGGMSRGITIGNMPSATGEWLGSISVNSVTLAPVPEYTQTDLGAGLLKGAVGEVPYGAHFFESIPAYDANSGNPGTLGLTATNPSQEITIAHYGIIGALAGGPAKPFTVYEAASSHCLGTCVHGSLVDKTHEWTLEAVGTGTTFRNMVLKGTARVNKHYHVEVNGTLKCRDVFGEPETATTKPYTFIFNTN